MATRGKANKLSELSVTASPTTTNANLVQLIERKFNELQVLFECKLKESEDRIIQRLSAIEGDIANVRVELKTTTSKLNKLEKRCELLEFENKNLSKIVSTLENNAVAADVVLLNIPNEIKPTDAFNKIVSVLPGEQIKAHQIFRSYSANNASKSIPIIAKLVSAQERTKFFRALASYKSQLKRRYKLSDFGLSGDANVVVHECLSSFNRDVLRSALHFQRNKLLNSVFTLRGSVLVRKRANDVAVKISGIDALNKLVGSLDNDISDV